MKKAIVKLGFCLLFFCLWQSAIAGVPSVTITQTTTATPAIPLNTSPLTYEVLFSEAVSGFDQSDVTVAGAGAGTPVVVVGGAGPLYTLSITGHTNGLINVSIAANKAASVATPTDLNTASNVVALTFDNQKPTPSINHLAPDPTTGASTITFTVNFGELIVPSTFTPLTLSFTGSGAGPANLSVSGSDITTSDDQNFQVVVHVSASAPTGSVILTIPAGTITDLAGNTNNAQSVVDNTVTYGGVLPVVISPTVSVASINDGEAVLGGDVSASGGSAIAERGVYVSVNSNIDASAGDIKFMHGSNTTGVFTLTVDLTTVTTPATGKHFYFRPYAKNALNVVTFGPEVGFWSLSTAPNSPGAPTLSIPDVTTPGKVRIEFTEADAMGAAEGYVILRRENVESPTSDLPDGIHPTLLSANSLPASSVLVAHITTGTTDFFEESGVPGCKDWYYVAIPYNWDGVNPETTNYRYGGATFNSDNIITWCSASTIENNGPGSKQMDFFGKSAMTITNSSDGLEVFELRLRDGGGTDLDDRKTELASLTISIDHPEYLNAVALVDGSTVLRSAAAAASVTFDLTTPTINTIIANDNSNNDFSIYVTFKQTAVIDQSPVIFTVTGATVRRNTGNQSGSGFAAGNAGGATTGQTAGVGNYKVNVVATKMEFTTVSAGITANNNFTVEVTAMDANNNIDTNVGGNITLTRTVGLGSLTYGSDTDTKAIGSNGKAVWTQLQFTQAGDKTVKADHSGSIGDATKIISVLSLGTKVDSPATLNLCFSSSANSLGFQTLGSIVIRERDASDFGAGPGQTYSMLAPDGFIFDASTIPTIVVTGGEISNLQEKAFGGSGGNTILRFKYDVATQGNGAVDVITITNLKVKYTGTTVVANQPIIRIGGTAVQDKNADTDFATQPHALLTSVSNNTNIAVTFENVAAGNITTGQTSFSKVSDPVVTLQGKIVSPASNINYPQVAFSGDGISLDGTQWKFAPAAVALGLHTLTIQYTDPGSGCISVATKDYSIYSSIINNLQPSYCINDPIETLGSPTNPNPGGQCLNISTGLFINSYNPVYRYIDYTFNIFGQAISGFYANLPNQGQFNPNDPAWAEEINFMGFVYVSVWWVPSSCNLGSEQFGGLASIIVKPKPVTTMSPTFPYGVCASDTQSDMSGSNFNAGGGDLFWTSPVGNPGGSAPGIGPPTAGVYKFVPAVANATSNDKQVQINYRHKDSGTGCTNEIFAVVNVWAKPDAVATTAVKIRDNPNVNGQFCFGESLTPFSTTPAAPAIHKWSIDGGGRPPVEGDEFALSPNDFDNTAGVPDIGAVAEYQLTQIVHRQLLGAFQVFPGCESNPTDLTVEIMQPTIAEAGAANPICEGNPLFLAPMGASINSPHVGLAANWSSTSPVGSQGTFRDGAGLIQDGNITKVFGQATRYFPSQAEIDARTVTLRLTTAEPNGPCGIVFDDVFVTINPGVTVNFPVSPVRVCSTDEITVEGKVSNTALDFDWTVVPAQGLGVIKSGESHNKNVTTYVPDATEKNQGGAVTLRLMTADPDGPSGPCGTVSNTVQVFISQKPLLQAGADFDICADQTINLTGVKPAGLSSASSWTWTHDGAGGVANDHALVTTYAPDGIENPGPVEELGSKKITFTITSNLPGGLNQCPVETDEVIITIHNRPVAPQPSSAVPPTYCVGNPVDLLRATGTSLTWYDNTMSQLSTGPSLAHGVTADIEKKVTFNVTQTFDKLTGFAGCESTATPITITVNPNPAPTFNFAKQCLGDFMEFTDQSTLAQPSSGSRSIVSWQWNFDDGLGFTDAGAGAIPAGTQDGRTTGDYNNPRHQYKNTGNYNVRLNLVSSDGCTASFTHTPIQVGGIPEAKFTSRMICDEDDTEFKFAGAAPEVGSTFTYAWDFGDGGSGGDNTSAAKDPTHEFTDVGTYDVKLTVTTELSCSQTITQKTSILPYIKSFPYIQNFESANHGWVPEGFSASSWNLLTSTNHIKPDPGPGAGSKFWVTNTDVNGKATYHDGERSVLYGPCVNMTALSRPVLAMDYWLDTEAKGDGAYLEVMDESVANPVWVRMGDNSTGLNWYNESSIGGLARLNNVGQDISQLGWSGVTTEWKTGRFNLDDFAGKTRLRFRIVFGSNGSQPLSLTEPLDGFALDYFKLETRNRVVLVENFTSKSASTAVVGNTAAFQSFPSAGASREVVKIEYHTGLPAAAGDAADPIFTQNPMDPNARASFYGLSAVPRGYIDGYTNTAGNGMFGNASGNINNWASTYYSTESLVTSPLDIIINTPTITNGTLRITGSVRAKEFELKANQYSIYVAVVEEAVGTDAFVLRKMLPTASGRKVPLTAAGQSFTFDESWSVDRSYLGANPKLIAVAFVQADILNNNGTRQVLQAAYNSDVPVVNFTTGVEPVALEQTAIHPNPADGLLNVELPHATATGVEVKVIDQWGRPVLQSAIGIGQRSTTIDTSGLAGAVYIVQLNENGAYTARKLVIAHRH